jgi:hypothetical protein
VLAFLKRRWILLSYAVLLTGFCAVSVGRKWSKPTTSGEVSLLNGNFSFDMHAGRFQEGSFEWSFAHSPCFGDLPNFYFDSGCFGVAIPLWLMLSAVIGWIVLRERRWREKREKE